MLGGENFEVVVKNTFIQVSEDAPGATDATSGLSTAPASLHRAGAMQRSLLAADDSTWTANQQGTTDSTERQDKQDAPRGVTESPITSTSTTAASTPPTPSQSVPATPAQDAGDVCLWPPTPASPRRERVSLSLVDLTEDWAPAAAATPCIYNFQGSGGMHPQTEAPAGFAPGFAPGPALLPPPPMEAPKLPPGVGSEGLKLNDGGPPPCGPAPLGKNNEPILACFANAPAKVPHYAPPSAPAPALPSEVPRFAPPSAPAPESLPSEDAFRGPPPVAPTTV